MKTCFLCGIEYDENARESVAEIAFDGEEEPTKILYISTNGTRWALCPACTRATAFGVSMAADNMTWLGPFEYETEPEEEPAQE